MNLRKNKVREVKSPAANEWFHVIADNAVGNNKLAN